MKCCTRCCEKHCVLGKVLRGINADDIILHTAARNHACRFWNLDPRRDTALYDVTPRHIRNRAERFRSQSLSTICFLAFILRRVRASVRLNANRILQTSPCRSADIALRQLLPPRIYIPVVIKFLTHCYLYMYMSSGKI